MAPLVAAANAGGAWSSSYAALRRRIREELEDAAVGEHMSFCRETANHLYCVLVIAWFRTVASFAVYAEAARRVLAQTFAGFRLSADSVNLLRMLRLRRPFVPLHRAARVWTAEEVWGLLATVPKFLACAILLIWATGLRAISVCDLRSGDLDRRVVRGEEYFVLMARRDKRRAHARARPRALKCCARTRALLDALVVPPPPCRWSERPLLFPENMLAQIYALRLARDLRHCAVTHLCGSIADQEAAHAIGHSLESQGGYLNDPSLAALGVADLMAARDEVVELEANPSRARPRRGRPSARGARAVGRPTRQRRLPSSAPRGRSASRSASASIASGSSMARQPKRRRAVRRRATRPSDLSVGTTRTSSPSSAASTSPRLPRAAVRRAGTRRPPPPATSSQSAAVVSGSTSPVGSRPNAGSSAPARPLRGRPPRGRRPASATSSSAMVSSTTSSSS